MTIEFVDFAQVHIIVDDLDAASNFYRNVLGFIEMQSHDNVSNAGLAAYYGHTGDPDDFRVSLRFMFIPDVVTIKLVEVKSEGYFGQNSSSISKRQYQKNSDGPSGGVGPLSVVVKDLDAAYQTLLNMARDYSSEYNFQLISPPVFLSPLRPHEIGATEHSVLHEQAEVLDEFAKTWPFRAKFQMIDPFGVRWEFNNDVDGPLE